MLVVDLRQVSDEQYHDEKTVPYFNISCFQLPISLAGVLRYHRSHAVLLWLTKARTDTI